MVLYKSQLIFSFIQSCHSPFLSLRPSYLHIATALQILTDLPGSPAEASGSYCRSWTIDISTRKWVESASAPDEPCYLLNLPNSLTRSLSPCSAMACSENRMSRVSANFPFSPPFRVLFSKYVVFLFPLLPCRNHLRNRWCLVSEWVWEEPDHISNGLGESDGMCQNCLHFRPLIISAAEGNAHYSVGGKDHIYVTQFSYINNLTLYMWFR